MKFSEITSLSSDDRKSKVIETLRELIKLRTQISTGTAQKSSGSIRKNKRSIARLLHAEALASMKSLPSKKKAVQQKKS